MAKNLGFVFLVLVVLLVPCSINYGLVSAQPQELLPQIEWRRMMITVRSSRSQIGRQKRASPSPSSPPSLLSQAPGL
ncbi:transmembrane protein [Arabidopsis thaliana]|uniref:Transmembrane protein n=1 Tax=Arabidopsis thaliana TaxID=3702 RepID=A0A1P8BDK1_ARATH|nr:uncharacterized protein AT5G44563 [Arabidopsis thaliana]ANM69659.1 transmembrane protein [Arabidopsis thaliana]|eukprot:NP_001331321.1 transmembrane protein [Arabidopsis thaliana]